MRKLSYLISVILISIGCIYGQEERKYSSLINEAWDFYKNEEYDKSALKYSEAFVVGKGGTLIDMYNAACSWALAGRPDSSFNILMHIVNKGNFTDIDLITTDPDFNSLHDDSRWNKLVEKIMDNREHFDEHLILVLDTIMQEDQGFREQANKIEQKYGNESNEFNEFVKIIRENDSINRVKVTNILDEHGWLGPDVIGNQGNTTLFLVIQHSDPETLNKYLPMMRDAVSKGNASPAHLALLEDRAAIYNGEKQIFGSQIGQDPETKEYYVLPLIDPDNVNKRRAEVCLDPIEDYIDNWGIIWDVEKYKKDLPIYEAMRKK